jgi:hypothetical protein
MWQTIHAQQIQRKKKKPVESKDKSFPKKSQSSLNAGPMTNIQKSFRYLK